MKRMVLADLPTIEADFNAREQSARERMFTERQPARANPAPQMALRVGLSS